MLVPAMLGTVEPSSAGRAVPEEVWLFKDRSEEPGHEMSSRAHLGHHPARDRELMMSDRNQWLTPTTPTTEGLKSLNPGANAGSL